MNIYVGNLPYTFQDQDLSDLFSEHGAVQSAKVIMDRDSGRSKGFGFVEMDDEAGKAAIAALDGTDAGGRALRVNEARPREPRQGGGGGGGGGGFRGPRREDRGSRNW